MASTNEEATFLKVAFLNHSQLSPSPGAQLWAQTVRGDSQPKGELNAQKGAVIRFADFIWPGSSRFVIEGTVRIGLVLNFLY